MVQPSALDFEVRKFAFYEGPNWYLPVRAMVFNVYLDPTGWRAEHYLPHVIPHFRALEGQTFERMTDLFVALLREALRLDIGVYGEQWAIQRDGTDTVVAVECVDERTGRKAAEAIRDWLRAINEEKPFDWPARLSQLQRVFDRSPLGGPTIYSLVEAGWRRGIPVLHLEYERCFQWGYGSRAVRGRSTVFHTDSVRDTEFTTLKDRVKEFLGSLGFPVPQGSTCDTEEELVEAAEEIGYPVVVKPVSGHKGQGVSTHLQNAEEVVAAFRRIHHGGEDETLVGDGVIIESFVEGGDYRLLAVAGKYVAALHREPPSVTGDGSSTVEELIAAENSRERRRDTIRSPLGRIICDEDLVGYLRQQELDLSSIPDREQRVPLRRIANISAGGVSINVTDELHPDNRALVESIAAFFQVTCLGIDVIAADITRSWKEGQFGIIEINAGPGIFMHLAPAVGNPVDVPGRVMDALFPSSDRARVPLVVGNGLSAGFCQRLRERFQRMDPNVRVATLDGVGEFLIQGQPVTAPLPFHRSLLTLLRHPHTDIAIISHTKDTIFDHGTIHTGADIVVLRNPHYAEKILQRDINPGGILALVDEEAVVLSRDGLEVGRLPLVGVPDWEEVVVAALTPFLPPLVERSRP